MASPGIHQSLSPQAEIPAEWLGSLRFRLSRSSEGDYRFSHVRFGDAAIPTQRVEFLMELLTGRALADVLNELAPKCKQEAGTEAGGRIAVELRAYLQSLSGLVAGQPGERSVSCETTVTKAGAQVATALRSDCKTCPRHLLAMRQRGTDASEQGEICDCAKGRIQAQAAKARCTTKIARSNGNPGMREAV